MYRIIEYSRCRPSSPSFQPSEDFLQAQPTSMRYGSGPPAADDDRERDRLVQPEGDRATLRRPVDDDDVFTTRELFFDNDCRCGIYRRPRGDDARNACETYLTYIVRWPLALLGDSAARPWGDGPPTRPVPDGSRVRDGHVTARPPPNAEISQQDSTVITIDHALDRDPTLNSNPIPSLDFNSGLDLGADFHQIILEERTL
ncbi:hypothetical protein EVAR_99045_1 [Eumeta japonica]|uniref:Uncharacterized protein n=1 Tax=Eumeta variegata TaxID=151549 RepID=A0A4C1Y1D0_EUMVA|nr:hypothetical protein EVAR_99045_1 [Eumeta japonica]